jgi:ATP-binding cassette subfamily F protein 3
MTERPIASLSGGEKARLVLALIAATKPAMLVLDEPTNHLDLDMRDALAIALGEYEGAVLLVAHDRNLLEKTVDQFWVLDNSCLTVYEGDMRDYTAQQLSRPSSSAKVKSSNRDLRKQRAHSRESLRELRQGARKLEKRMERFTQDVRDIETKLADPEVYATLPAQELDELLASAASKRKELESIEEAWLEATEQLEKL